MSLAADPILRDRGLALRWFPVTDTSRVVVWFTRRHGRLSTLIKGSQRPKSWMLGQYDLFHTCEVLFYARAREDLHILRECSPLERRPGLRRKWRACAAASFAADLLYRVSPPLAAAPVLYDLGERTLDRLAAGAGSAPLLFWFELRVLAELGLTPELGGDDGPTRFDPRAGRIGEAEDARELTGGVRALMRRLLETDDPSGLERVTLRPAQVRELAGHLERFTAWHLDLPPPSRRLALEWLERDLPISDGRSRS